MRYVRVFDTRGQITRELLNVAEHHITASGALVVTMADRDADDRLCSVALAAGSWATMEEWTGTPPTTPARPVPDPIDTVGILRHTPPDSPLRRALTIWCTCSTPHQHAPDCPRHPDRYNKPATPPTGQCGRAETQNGVPILGNACLLPWGHDGAHVFTVEGQSVPALVPVAAGITTDATPRRVKPTPRTSAAMALRAAGLLVIDRPPVEHQDDDAHQLGDAAPVVEHQDDDAKPVGYGDDPAEWFRVRQTTRQCTATEPTGIDVTCERTAGHDGPHAHFRLESGLIQW